MTTKSKPAVGAVVVVPSNSANLADPARGLWVGVKGDISVEMVGVGTAIVFKGAVGVVPISVTRVNLTATNATDILALY